MGITSALYTGVSGMRANSDAMNVIGNNIANVNTTGYKGARTLFSDMISTSVAKNNSQVGLGTQVQAIQNMYSQGGFASTQSETDLAIQGDAMFVLKSANANNSNLFYSRAGAFTLDKNQFLTNADGYQVMGYGMSGGVAAGALKAINLQANQNMPATATTKMNLTANFDKNAVTAPTWDPLKPVDTSNFSTNTTVYDATGTASSETLYFRKTATAWEFYATSDGGLTFSPAQTLTFNAAGALTTAMPLSAIPGVMPAIDFTGSTQSSSSSSIGALSQDGYAGGMLQKVTVDEKGIVNGVYNNGQQQAIAQVGLAKFASLNGLEKSGNSLFSATNASGAAVISSSNNATNKVLSKNLEQSTVDLATELVNMIVTQRAYQANSKTITANDQLTQEAIQMVR
jgi:flagellar hook protein FlgE